MVELTIRGCVRTDQAAKLYALPLTPFQATPNRLHERYEPHLAAMTADLAPDSLDLLRLDHIRLNHHHSLRRHLLPHYHEQIRDHLATQYSGT